jgi:GPH family glycoside/pentoside/hexuronide:cation symporter
LGYGIALLWPLVRKYGKRPVALVGFTIAAAGSLIVFFAWNDMKLVLIGLLIRSTGSLPTYTMMALLAEALDNIEKTQGFRPDGFSASFYSIIHTVMMGLGQTILLAGINLFGYIVPQSTAQIIAQPEAVTSFFRWCFAGLPTVLYGICAVIMLFYKPNQTTHK